LRFCEKRLYFFYKAGYERSIVLLIKRNNPILLHKMWLGLLLENAALLRSFCGYTRFGNTLPGYGGTMSFQSASAAERLLTIADIARHFSLPESTARYYCKRFAAYMPVCGEGRRKRYRKTALDVIRAVLEAMRDARTATGVEAMLAENFPCNALSLMNPEENIPLPDSTLPVPSQGVPLQLIEQQSRALEGIASALALLVRRQDDLEVLAEQARAAQAENKILRAELDRLRLDTDNAEKLQQQDLEQLRTWLGRLMRLQLNAVSRSDANPVMRPAVSHGVRPAGRA
jgi:DNA-binding transcriptional MerR regulator